MPEYLAPGVYVEEVSFRAKSIEGVGTSTAGFVGLARSEWVSPSGALGPFTDQSDFERQTGANPNADGSRPDFLWYAVRAFFAEGGKRLWITMVSREALNKGGASCSFEHALDALAKVDEVTIIAAPGLTYLGSGCSEQDALAVSSMLLARAAPKRFALLDPPSGYSADQVRAWRSRFASSYGALYYPWLTTTGATDGTQLVPPSPFVAAAYARSDAERGAWTAPDNEMLRSVTGVERAVADAEQSQLNKNGINVIRELPQQGVRLAGSRTLTSNGEWKYINVRRYLAYIEASIATGIAWAVFEPNGVVLWAVLRRSIEEFLQAEWRRGALAGDRVENAYFVRCDRSTMTQDDLDNGHLIALVGVAIVRPAEFLILRIGVETRKPPD
jgi:phage tail sheath protein FI